MDMEVQEGSRPASPTPAAGTAAGALEWTTVPAHNARKNAQRPATKASLAATPASPRSKSGSPRAQAHTAHRRPVPPATALRPTGSATATNAAAAAAATSDADDAASPEMWEPESDAQEAAFEAAAASAPHLADQQAQRAERAGPTKARTRRVLVTWSNPPTTSDHARSLALRVLSAFSAETDSLSYAKGGLMGNGAGITIDGPSTVTDRICDPSLADILKRLLDDASARAYYPVTSATGNRVYVEGLPRLLNEQQSHDALMAFFTKAGLPPHDVKPLRAKNAPHMLLGTALVVFSARDAAARALELPSPARTVFIAERNGEAPLPFEFTIRESKAAARPAAAAAGHGQPRARPAAQPHAADAAHDARRAPAAAASRSYADAAQRRQQGPAPRPSDLAGAPPAAAAAGASPARAHARPAGASASGPSGPQTPTLIREWLSSAEGTQVLHAAILAQGEAMLASDPALYPPALRAAFQMHHDIMCFQNDLREQLRNLRQEADDVFGSAEARAKFVAQTFTFAQPPQTIPPAVRVVVSIKPPSRFSIT